MRLTVLGKSPSWQDAGGACSGYLLEEGDTAVLIDCGNGVFSKLRQFRDYTEVDAVVLSHLHADHFLDLVPYSYALTYAPRQQPVPVHVWPGTHDPARPSLHPGPVHAGPGPDRPARPIRHAPPGAREKFRRVVGAWGNEDLIEKAFDLREYDPDDELTVGSLRLRFCEVPHFVQTCAIRLTSTNGGGDFVYGADSAPNEDLVAFADGADLLMVEGKRPRPEGEGPRGHLPPGEAGEPAARAKASRVVITPISDELGDDWA